MTARAGRKDDAGKSSYDLLPFAALEQVARVLTHGAAKYTPEGWRTVPEWRNRYLAAALRHLIAWQRGQAVDSDSGLPTLAHAACCVLFLAELDAARTPLTLTVAGPVSPDWMPFKRYQFKKGKFKEAGNKRLKLKRAVPKVPTIGGPVCVHADSSLPPDGMYYLPPGVTRTFKLSRRVRKTKQRKRGHK